MTAEEVGRLLAATRASDRSYRGLAGEDRYHLYAAACGLGFRASGLASLVPANFDFDAAIPTVTLPARYAKNRKTKVQPMPPGLAASLRDYLRGKPAGVPVWGGTWASDHRGAEMLRGDLAAAGIPYAVEGPDGPLYADFHSLRHTYLTLGGRAGIDLRTLQELAGHSTPTLTARYSPPPSVRPGRRGRTRCRRCSRRRHPASGASRAVRFLVARWLHGLESSRGTPGHPSPAKGGARGEGMKRRNPRFRRGLSRRVTCLASRVTSEDDGTRTRNHRIDSPVL